MDPIPDIGPISALGTRRHDLLDKASSRPILLTRHGHAAAVLMGPASYDRLLEGLEDLQLAIDAVEARSNTDSDGDADPYLAKSVTIAARMTSRGRVTIPKEIREHLKRKPGDRVFFVLRHGEVVMQAAVPTLLQLRGSIKPRYEPEDFGAAREKAKKAMERKRAILVHRANGMDES